MRISSVALLSLAGLVRIAHGENDFNKLRNIIDRLENDAQELTNAYNDKDDEVTLLAEMLAACQEGCGSGAPCSTSGSSVDTDDSSSPDSTSEGTGGDENDDEDDDEDDDSATHDDYSSPTTLDDTTIASTSTSDDDSAPSPGPSFGWVPRVGDTWNYNLATPVDTDIDADVFVIDMGRNMANCVDNLYHI